jgi:uncharacterized protein (DUF433 family)
MSADGARDPQAPSVARKHRSFRLPPETLRKLEQRARETATSQAALAERYLDEGFRRDEHPSITFVDGPAGRRPRVAGTGLDVWEVIETIRSADGSVEEASAYLGIPARLVREALRYYADYRPEIDAWTGRMREASDREQEAEQRLRAALR